MLPSKNRIRSSEFPRNTRNARSIQKRFFSFSCVLPRSEATQQNAFAVVVPKTVIKSAVARNKLRRRTYSALSALSELWPRQAMLCVVFFKKGSQEATYTTILSELKASLEEFKG